MPVTTIPVTAHDVERHNAPLRKKMRTRGFTLQRKDQNVTFCNAEGEFTKYPVSYITGPTEHPRGGVYISVCGLNGWLQRNFPTPEEARAWALPVAQEVLNTMKTNPQPLLKFTIWPDGTFEGEVPSELYGITTAAGNPDCLQRGIVPCGDGCDFALNAQHRQHLQEAWDRAEETQQAQVVDFSAVDPVLLEMGYLVVDTKANALRLPRAPKLDQYAAIKQRLVTAGGTYRQNAFYFSSSVQEIFDSLLQGGRPDPRKQWQFFPTPSAVAQRMVALASPRKGEKVLEPSAGAGAILDALPEGLTIHAVEIQPELVQQLQSRSIEVVCGDFLEQEAHAQYDLVIANPPFSRNRDIAHVRHMMDFCKPGGRVVCIMSPHWRTANYRGPREFREWIQQFKPRIEEIPAGAFKESGTTISTLMLRLDKPTA